MKFQKWKNRRIFIKISSESSKSDEFHAFFHFFVNNLTFFFVFANHDALLEEVGEHVTALFSGDHHHLEKSVEKPKTMQQIE